MNGNWTRFPRIYLVICREDYAGQYRDIIFWRQLSQSPASPETIITQTDADLITANHSTVNHLWIFSSRADVRKISARSNLSPGSAAHKTSQDGIAGWSSDDKKLGDIKMDIISRRKGGEGVGGLSVQDNNKDLCAVIGRHYRPMFRADPHRTYLSRVSASGESGVSVPVSQSVRRRK